jgi:M23/M37 peptidase domain protein
MLVVPLDAAPRDCGGRGAPAATWAQQDPKGGERRVGEVLLVDSLLHTQGGSLSDFSSSVANYGDSRPSCYEFKGYGESRGTCMKNEVASVENRTGLPVTIYFNSGYRGDSQVVPAGASANLVDDLKNDNASHRLGGE